MTLGSTERVTSPPLPPPVRPKPGCTPVTIDEPSTASETVPDVPPPVSPAPAVTPVMSPPARWICVSLSLPAAAGTSPSATLTSVPLLAEELGVFDRDVGARVHMTGTHPFADWFWGGPS